MRMRRLGRTGLRVSRLCLGTMAFGNQQWGCDEPTSRKIVDRFLDAGGNFLDTADVYGSGVSEEITGRGIAGKRQQVILATKVAGSMGPSANDRGLSRKHILDAVDASLRRLGTDYIDLYQVHAPDPTTPIEETVRALDDCVRAGKVRYLGCSNYSAWQIMQAIAVAKELGAARYDCLQPQYSLVCRSIEREHLPLCAAEGIGVIPWSPLGGGFLSGRIRQGRGPEPGTRAADNEMSRGRLTQRNVEIAEAVAQVAEERGATSSQIALAWLLAQPEVTAPIFGARKLEQIEDDLGALDVELDDEAVARLDAVSRTPLDYPYDFQQRTGVGYRRKQR